VEAKGVFEVVGKGIPYADGKDVFSRGERWGIRKQLYLSPVRRRQGEGQRGKEPSEVQREKRLSTVIGVWTAKPADATLESGRDLLECFKNEKREGFISEERKASAEKFHKSFLWKRGRRGCLRPGVFCSARGKGVPCP